MISPGLGLGRSILILKMITLVSGRREDEDEDEEE
jgi:hypothetical protein